MTADGWAAIIPWVVTAIGVTGAGIWAIVNRRGGERYTSRIPLPASYSDLYARLSHVEDEVTRLRDEVYDLKGERQALRNIIYDLADQWPIDRPKPALNQVDVDILGDTMPHKFRSTRRPSK